MKIAVATNDKSTICSHLGQCKSFLIFEVSNGEIESESVRDNSFTSHATGSCNHDHDPGHGDHGHDDLIKAVGDCDVVISRGMGWKIAKDLENVEIKPIVTIEVSAKEAVRKYLEGKLEHLTGRTCYCGGSD